MSVSFETMAGWLDEARLRATPTMQLSERAQKLDLDMAYAVQRAGVELRAQRGEQVAGVKLGFTSKAKAKQMGVSDVIIGVLTDQMDLGDAGVLDLAHYLHPRVEPEVAFRLSRSVDLADPDSDVLGAVDAVAPALEVIDSRYLDFRFALADVVADNASASAFAVGAWRPVSGPAHLELRDVDVDLTVDGKSAEHGSTADILGNPWAALSAVQRLGAHCSQRLPAGGLILAGAATAAKAVSEECTIAGTVAGLGSVSIRTVRVEHG